MNIITLNDVPQSLACACIMSRLSSKDAGSSQPAAIGLVTARSGTADCDDGGDSSTSLSLEQEEIFQDTNSVGADSLWSNVTFSEVYLERVPKYQFRIFKSKSAALLLLDKIIITSATAFFFDLSVSARDKEYNPRSVFLGVASFFLSYSFCFIPGLIADLWLGRYKTVQYSIFIVWVSVLLATLGTLIDAQSLSNTSELTLVIYFISSLLYSVGRTGFDVNVIPLGTDQLKDSPSDEFCSFVHWLVLSDFFGQGIGYLLADVLYFICKQYYTIIYGCVLSFAFTALLLLDNCWTHAWMIKEKPNRNPYWNVVRVLSYAWNHKVPERRSALTYWEDSLPSRIDLGKSKYGGPFTTEEVEDVKTYFRIMGFITSAIALLALHAPTVTAIFLLFDHLELKGDASISKIAYSPQITVLVAMVYILSHELLVHPFMRRCVPGMRKRLWISLALYLCSIICNLFIDFIGHLKTDGEVSCLFNEIQTPNFNVTQLNDTALSVLAPSILGSFGNIIGFIAVMEFLLAQAPYAMKGLLIGSFYSTWALGNLATMALMLLFPQYRKTSEKSQLSCGSLYYLLCTVAAIIGLVAFTVMLLKYSNRKRDEVIGNEQQFAVKYYEQQIERSSRVQILSNSNRYRQHYGT